MIMSNLAIKKYLDCRIVIPMDIYLKIKEIADEKRMKFIEQKAEVIYSPINNTVNIEWPK